MAFRRVHTGRFDGYSVTIVETKSHRLLVNNVFAGARKGSTVLVNPTASAPVRMTIEAYARQHDGMAA